MLLRFLLLCLFAGAAQASGPNVLSNTDHIVSSVTSAISILGGSATVDQTCPTGGPGFHTGSTCGGVNSFVTPTGVFVGYATNTLINEYTAGTATIVNHAPYGVINQSSTGYSLNIYDQQNYTALENQVLYMTAYCGGPGAGDTYPPVAVSTILPNTTGALSSNACGYATGIEFSMTAGYKGFTTGTPSGTTEAMSGVYQVLSANHPTWTWSDVKAALRQTASNWSGGYAAMATPSGVVSFGFGNINFDAATAIASTASIFLQSPGMVIQNHGYYINVSLYPFLTTRRAKEVVYLGGTWPAASAGNELTAAQVTAAGGTKIFDDGGATGIQNFNYGPAASGSAVFTALTLDASGNASRVESYNLVTESFIVGTACQQ